MRALPYTGRSAYNRSGDIDMRRHAAAMLLAVAAALTLGACTQVGPDPSNSGGSAADIDDIILGQSDALAPTITLPEGETFTEPQGTVVWKGDGAALQDN